MNVARLRPIVAMLGAAAVCIAVSPHTDAARTSGILERIVARAVDVADPTQATRPIDILIERWSTAEEVEPLRGTIPRGTETLLPALQKTWRPTGVVLSPGIMNAGERALGRRAQNLLFARETTTAKGRQVILASDQHLWLGEPAGRRTDGSEFTLIDIRFGPDGKGIGKVASAANAVYNKNTKLIEVKNYTAEPVRLTEVRSARP